MAQEDKKPLVMLTVIGDKTGKVTAALRAVIKQGKIPEGIMLLSIDGESGANENDLGIFLRKDMVGQIHSCPQVTWPHVPSSN